MTGANIARAMQVSAPTVHEMIGRLESRRLRDARRRTSRSAFTDTGREHADDIVRRHRLIERFLTDVFDIPWDEVHEEAERLEHWMSPTVEERMLNAIGDAKTCPHGHPIFEGAARAGRAARGRRGGRQGAGAALRERGRGPAALPDGHRACTRASRARSADPATRWWSTPAARSSRSRRSVAETVSVIADPSPPARVALPDQLVLAKEHWGR